MMKHLHLRADIRFGITLITKLTYSAVLANCYSLGSRTSLLSRHYNFILFLINYILSLSVEQLLSSLLYDRSAILTHKTL